MLEIPLEFGSNSCKGFDRTKLNPDIIGYQNAQLINYLFYEIEDLESFRNMSKSLRYLNWWQRQFALAYLFMWIYNVMIDIPIPLGLLLTIYFVVLYMIIVIVWHLLWELENTHKIYF